MPEHSGENSLEATPHRRQQARDKGQVAFSQDLASAAVLIVAILLLKWLGPSILNFNTDFLRQQLTEAGSFPANRETVIQQAVAVMFGLGMVLAPLLGLLMSAGVLANVLQVGFLFVPERLSPNWSRLSPSHGLQRIVSLSGFMRLGFGLIKIVVIVAVTVAVVWNDRNAILCCGALEFDQLGLFLLKLTLTAALWIAGALLVLAVFDYGFQRWKYERDLRMTHQEIREEMKSLQGAPQIVARRRQIQQQLALNRVGDKVSKADVIVANPAKLAIAIQYLPDRMVAPIVLTKGAGMHAERIQKLAIENDIPIVERKSLAQLLYRKAAVNRPVPSKSHAAVAEVLAYVYQLKEKKLSEMPQAT